MDKVFYVTSVREQDWDSRAEMSPLLPATPYELLDSMEKLRLAPGAPVQVLVEALYRFDDLSAILSEPCDLYALNALAQRLCELPEMDCAAFEGLLEMEIRQAGDAIPLSRLLDLAYSTDCCHVVGDALNDGQLGRFYAENGFVPGVEDLPEELFDLLDFERIGRERRLAEGGVFTSQGYVLRHSELRRAPPVQAFQVPDYLIQMEDGICLDCCVPCLTDLIIEAGDSPLIARLERRLADMADRTAYKALLEALDCQDLRQAVVLADTLGSYLFTPHISSPVEMAKDTLSYILSEREAERLMPYLNLYQYGEALLKKGGGVLTSYGLLERRDGQPVQGMEVPQSGLTMR